MSLQIFILGTLCDGESHPYDIKKKIFKYADNVVQVNDGTLYYNFEVLAKKGYIRKIKVVQSDNRPEKTTYGITDAGRKALEQSIYDSFRSGKNMTSLYASVYFLDLVDKNRLAYLIEDLIERRTQGLRLLEKPGAIPDDIPPNKTKLVGFIADHAKGTLQTDLEWLGKLLHFLREEA